MKHLVLVLCASLGLIACESPQPETFKLHSDNGDGTFTNPVIAADYPDPDVIRVGDTYYFVSTTMFIFPGVTILKSKDLVNWEYASNALPNFEYSECYNMMGCDRYRHGQWATSLKYHEGKFHLLFITLDEGGFHLTAENAEGPWEINHLPKGFYDPGLFYDDDGRIYVTHGYGDIYLTEVDENLHPLSEDSLIFTGDIRGGLEGMHVYKINDYYYLYGTYGGLDGFQVALRSKNIYGPYDQNIAIRDTTHGPNFGIHQGALIETQAGEWWTLLFVDSGAFGRFPSLQPVTWVDGWPIVGVGGKAVTTYQKPNVAALHPTRSLPTSDEFEEAHLGLQWGWNHNPVSDKWSLDENPGHLRLRTASVTNNLRKARNMLTQRMFAYYSDTVATLGTMKMNLEHMIDGDIAGLAIFQDPYAYIAVKRVGEEQSLVMVNNGNPVDSISINTGEIYFRADPVFGSGAAPLYGGETTSGTGIARFYYSFDNETYTRLGDELNMQFNLSVFTGNKFGLFNYATKELGGFVDIDWFRMVPSDEYPLSE